MHSKTISLTCPTYFCRLRVMAHFGTCVTVLSLLGCGTSDGSDADEATGDESFLASGGNGSNGGGGTAAGGDVSTAGGISASGGGQGTGGAGIGGSGGGVNSCGEATCAPGQYCRAGCNGTGGPIGAPSCQAVPTGCENDVTCDCICGGFTSFCTPGAEAIQCGCP